MPKQKIDAIIYETKEYLVNNPNIKTLILGLSGGVDSALVAVLMNLAIKDLDVKLYGYSLPIGTNKPDEIRRAEVIGTAFCDGFWIADLFPYYNRLLDALLGISVPFNNRKQKIRAGNIKARMRMIYLYDKAQEHDGLVLSTDNYTEYLLGFWTLHGDVGDFGAIQNLWKSEVYGITNYLYNTSTYVLRDAQKDALRDCVIALPTDGLGISETDMDQLLPDWKCLIQEDNKFVGWLCYEKIDGILKEWLHGDYTKINPNDPVILRYNATKFKRNNPYNCEGYR
jgi:NAD+ synthase